MKFYQFLPQMLTFVTNSCYNPSKVLMVLSVLIYHYLLFENKMFVGAYGIQYMYWNWKQLFEIGDALLFSVNAYWLMTRCFFFIFTIILWHDLNQPIRNMWRMIFIINTSKIRYTCTYLTKLDISNLIHTFLLKQLNGSKQRCPRISVVHHICGHFR